MPTALSGHVFECLPECRKQMPLIRACGPLDMNDHRKACRRYNEPGHAHSLTFSCFGRRPFLNKDRTRQWLVEAIDRARQIHGLDLWAYVIMPEHVHLLIWPHTAQYSVSAILTSVKRPVSLKALSYVRTSAPTFLSKMEDRQPNGSIRYRFWQRGGGYDRNLTEPKTVWAEIDYFHMNPVRRGLCRSPIAWPWSSAAEQERPGTGPLRLNHSSLPRTSRG
jgi:putative transposase